jgi:23S rRNA (guanine745-N1)-methyltransferase
VLLCTVRGCGAPLTRSAGNLVCSHGHAFDVARSGYINLLQPQDRRSRHPGDSAAALAARRRLHDLGCANPLRDALREITQLTPKDTVLDAGCGDGFYLGTLARQIGFRGYGIDISTRAVDAAARRYPECEWIVANADRFIPFTDAAFSLVWSITARMNPAEFRRVLTGDGRLLVAIPAPDDLIELRGAGRDRAARTVESFSGQFALTRKERITTSADLSAASLHDVLVSIYRPMRSQPVEAMRVTFSLDLLLFAPR